ncbi:50S ribosomal protein L4 [Lamprobacter modestohalophilus]|uniref:Large ribosomal subunit protein uL4 n=1 Tax=Lamprobacter modestohalophilus TaxID=1064514 RepID=A0A9X0W799_9GAMM|nr:50S ribosomal protein L4 [Lamprobacter modestohalophilus]MBK1618094.1 50S ribosomal protein L4 [Lamprobacter modestohalophilus]
MELAIRNAGSSSVQVADLVFGADYKPGLVHQVVTAYMAGGRAGTKAQKNRSAVSGGGAKPYRQKGTGRARAGTSRSPLWRSGGVTFAAQPRNYEQKVNRKMYRGALRSIVSELVRTERLLVVSELKIEAPKTKAVLAKLAELNLKRALVLVDEVDDNLALGARNLPGVWVDTAAGVDPVSLVAAEQVLITEAALRRLEERLS